MIDERQYTLRIVGYLQQHEERIGELYSEFAAIFPKTGEFWRRLVLEEKAHAAILEQLKTDINAGLVVVPQNRVLPVTLRSFTEYIDVQLRFVRNSPPGIREALAIALDLEGTLLEHSVDTYFHGDTPRIADVASEMSKETNQHIAQLQALKLQAS